MHLDSRTVVVTGAGRGIGAATAMALAEAGAAVVLAARTKIEIEQLADRLTAHGHRAVAIPCDVSDPVSIMELAAHPRVHGEVDVLVNNAGIASSAPLHRIALEDWNKMMAVNVTGAMLCMQAFVPQMVHHGWGRVINVASIAGLTGAKYIAAYSASKHALIGLTRSVAAEVADRGVTVNAVCPGYVDTPMTTGTVERIVEKTGEAPERAREAILEMSPQHRLIEPSEVAQMVLNLCDSAAAGVTGQAIAIDGGALLL